MHARDIIAHAMLQREYEPEPLDRRENVGHVPVLYVSGGTIFAATEREPELERPQTEPHTQKQKASLCTRAFRIPGSSRQA